MIVGQSSGFMEKVTRMTRSQWYTLVTVFISAGILGLLFRRIFSEKLRRGAEALAVGVFLTAHASMLSTGARLLIVPPFFLWKGAAVDPVVPYSVGSLISVLYPGVAAYRGFGTSWKSAVKGMLGSVWAYVETIGIGGIAGFWYVFLTTPGLREGLSGEEGIVPLVTMTVIYLIPLFLHAGMEAYYRLR